MILVSACLLGENCKYSGGNNLNQKVMEFLEGEDYIPICPEVLGGLSVPREPAERVGDRVLNRKGEDVTKEFTNGAHKTLQLALKHQPKLIILKANSPTCGKGTIYDGTFSGRLIEGDGVTAELLSEQGFLVVTEESELILQNKK